MNALTFFGGSPRRIILENLKAAVVNGSGRHSCLHPEFLALCGHFCLEPSACERRDPESKGTVEAGVRDVKRNALAGREDELVSWDDYRQFAITWRDDVANVRLHQTTRQRPVDRFAQESGVLRPLPGFVFAPGSDRPVPVRMRSEAFTGDLRALRNLIMLSSSEVISGPTPFLIPGPRSDQRSVAAAP